MSKKAEENNKEYLGSQALLKSLEDKGVQTVFGYPGGVLLGLYDQIYAQDKIRHILVRHEQGAAHAADGYARVAGKPGVCLATSGPGATNLLTGICSAHMDSIPIVALTGQVATPMIGKDAFQEADLFNLSLPITKHNYLVKDNTDIPRTIGEAFEIATSGRPGPVLVDLPKDILNAPFQWDGEIPEPDLPGLPENAPVEQTDIEFARDLIYESEKPVLYIGGGVIHSGAGQLIVKLAEGWNIPIVWTLMGKGAVSDVHPLNLGMLGMHGTPAANYSVYESDLLIAVGVRFDDRATGKLDAFAPNAKVIHIDIDPAEIGKNRIMKPAIDVSLVGDASNVVSRLLDILKKGKNNTKEWLGRIREWQSECPLDDQSLAGEITPQDIFKALNKVACDGIYTTDVGQHQMWAAQYIQAMSPRHWITSGGLGTMGFGLPAAIGAKAACQDIGLDRPVICISGDGSFQMNQQEIGTMVAHDIPVINIILNNDNLGMVRQWQELFFDRHYSYSHLKDGSPDFVKLAESYGVQGLRTADPSQLEDMFSEAVKSGQPCVLDLTMHPEANVFPIVPPGGANYRAEGINIPTVPTARTYNDYMQDVDRAPVNKLNKKSQKA